jgi:hypothetical protein
MNFCTQSVFGVTFILVLGSLLGCRGQTASQKQVLEQTERLYQKYLEADPAEAKKCLEDEIALLEKSTVLDRSGRAHDLFMTFSRLYVLEAAAGDKDRADAALIKARYWNLLRFELSGVPTEKAIVEVRSFTPEKTKKIIENADKNLSNGKGARYSRTSNDAGEYRSKNSLTRSL